MTKAQAVALMGALEGQKVPADAQMRFDQAGNETWQVQVDPSVALSGAQLVALSNYCAGQGLTISATFSQLGII